MGVQGLWSILQCTGKDIELGTLKGKILAIDINIWVNQALKANSDIPNAHLQLLFRRICKLLFYNIKPIFVFDGPCPQLKKTALEQRKRRRNMKQKENELIKRKIINLYMKKKAVQGRKDQTKLDKFKNESIFDLPQEDNLNEDLVYQDNDYKLFAEEYINNFSSIEDVDVESEAFSSIPLEVQHEVIKIIAKDKRYGFDSNQKVFANKTGSEFSDFQIRRMLDRNRLNDKMDELKNNMNQVQSNAALNNYLSSDVLGSKSLFSAQKVASHESGYLMLINQELENTESQNDQTISNVDDLYHQLDKVDDKVATSNSHILSDSEMKSIMKSAQKLANFSENISKSSNQIMNTFVEDNEHSRNENCNKSEQDDGEKNIEISMFENISRPSNKIKNTFVEDNEHSRNENCNKSQDDGEKNINRSSNKIKNMDSVNEKCDKSQDDGTNGTEIDGQIIISENQVIEKRHNEKNNEESEKNTTDDDDDDDDDEDNDFIDVEDEELEKIEKIDKIDSEIEQNPGSVISEDNSLLSFSTSELDIITNNLTEWEQEVNEELDDLKKEEMKLDRQTTTMKDQYYQEAKDLLTLFGIPYVNSPGEAEAQCACLERLGLVEGTVTEDSDIWLFGGRNVYKSMFVRNKSARFYSSRQIQKKLGLDRDLMICIALLSGSDYTPGIYGIGPVIAMEILADFSSQNTTHVHMEVLEEFKKWYDTYKECPQKCDNENRSRYLRFNLDIKFPDRKIFEAYQSPLVDDSTEPFTWVPANIEKLIEFAVSKLGWKSLKAVETLEIINKSDKYMKQSHIFDYFNENESSELEDFLAKRSPSKRLITAVSERHAAVKRSKK